MCHLCIEKYNSIGREMSKALRFNNKYIMFNDQMRILPPTHRDEKKILN